MYSRAFFPKYLGKYARKMRAGRYETGSEGKFASRWRAKSPDALCAVLPYASSGVRETDSPFRILLEVRIAHIFPHMEQV